MPRPRDLVVVGLLLAGCAEPPVAPPPLAVARPSPPVIALTVSGIAVDPAPEPYQPKVGWLQLEQVAEEGRVVDPGEVLFAANLTVARRWMADRELEMGQLEAEVRRDRLRTVDDLQRKRDAAAETTQRRDLLSARVAAAGARDAEALAIAELELERGRARLAEAQRVVDRCERLMTAGVIDEVTRRQALAALAAARDRLKPLRLRRDLAAEGGASFTTLRLDLDRSEAAAGLERDGGGSGALALAIEVLERTLAGLSGPAQDRLRRLRLRHQQDQVLVEDSTVRATVAGVADHGEALLGPNARPPPSTVMMMVQAADSRGFEASLPERWRDLVASAGAGAPEGVGGVRIDVPHLGLRDLPGRVVAVSATARDTSEGRCFTARLAAASPIVGLRPGMRVDLRLLVPAPPAAVLLPAWALTDRLDPAAEGAAGGPLPLVGRVVGPWFIGQGLAAGAAVRAVPTARGGGAALRLPGTVRARTERELMVPWGCELTMMVDDGATVARGDVVARLVRTRRDEVENKAEEAQLILAQAGSDRAVAVVRAEADLAEAETRWLNARIDVERRSVDLAEALAARNAITLAERQVALADARRRQEAADERLARAEVEARSGFLADHALRDRRLEARRARAGVLTAALAEAAERRAVDQLSASDRRAALAEAVEKAEALRLDLGRARRARQQALFNAERAWQQAGDRSRDLLRRLEEETLRAPFAGRVYHLRDWRGETPAVGRELRTTRPFAMPVDHRRVVRCEVAEHLRDRLHPGEAVRLRLPLLGMAEVPARCEAVSPQVRPSTEAVDDPTSGLPPLVVIATIALDDAFCADHDLPPGTQAWLELSP